MPGHIIIVIQSKWQHFVATDIKALKCIRIALFFFLSIVMLCTSTADAYKLSGAKWPEPTTTFYVDIPGADGLWNRSFENAMGYWSSYTIFKYKIVSGVYKDPCDTSSSRNGVGFNSTLCGDEWGSTTLAVCSWWYSKTTIVKANIIFNSKYSWNVYSTSWKSNPADFQRVAVHELGHALGLGHEDSGIASIMKPYAGDTTVPQQDDIDGVYALYSPVNGTCGFVSGKTFGTVPTADLCSAGTTSTVLGSGPWTWSCTGSNGGSTAACSANKSSTCQYTISPSADAFASSSAIGVLSVIPSSSNCSWTSASNDSWIAIKSGSSGTGDGNVSYTVAANNTGAHRKGTMAVSAQTATIRQAKSIFLDDPNNVFSPYIYAIYQDGITVGCGNNLYCPENNVSRGQMAAFIIRAKYDENFNYTTMPYFIDVPVIHTFFKYVQKMKDTGITAVSGTYDVDGTVTRGQMAAFIIRAKYGESFDYTAIPYFTDVPATHGFFKYVQKMKDVGITAVSGSYDVNGLVTRAQMAAFLARAFLGMQ